MSEATSRANGEESSIRARVEHVFAHQKNWYGAVHPYDRPGASSGETDAREYRLQYRPARLP